MELASQKKEISFKGRGTSVCVAFEGAILPGISDVLRELRDAGSMVTGHQIVFDFKKLQVPRNWLLDLLRDVIFPMNLSVSLWNAEEPSTKENLASLGFKVDGSERPMVDARGPVTVGMELTLTSGLPQAVFPWLWFESKF